MKIKQRILWIDIARSIAIIFVVLNHATESIYPLNLEFYSTANNYSICSAFVLFTVARLGVPIFLFISGYFLLDKTYDNKQCVSFWSKNCFRLLVTTEIWIIIYNIFWYVFGNQKLSFVSIITEMLFAKQTNMSHMWYMPMILGMYVFIPFAANALHSLNTKVIIYASYLTAIITALFPIINIFMKAYGHEDFYSILSTGFSGGIYGLYLVLGYLCRKGFLKKMKSIYLGLSFIFLFIFTVFLQLFAYQHGCQYNVWYDCGTLMLTGLFLFEIISRIHWKNANILVYKIAKYAFAIYLIHNPVLILLNPYLSIIRSRSLRVLVLWIITVCISWVIACIIDHIPHAGKLLLYTD